MWVKKPHFDYCDTWCWGEEGEETEDKPQSTSQCSAPVSGVYWLQHQWQLSLSQQFYPETSKGIPAEAASQWKPQARTPATTRTHSLHPAAQDTWLPKGHRAEPFASPPSLAPCLNQSQPVHPNWKSQEAEWSWPSWCCRGDREVHNGLTQTIIKPKY